MKKTQENNGRITIYAELSKKQLGMLEREEAELEIPYGTEMISAYKRGLTFACANTTIAKELARGLDNSAINWQVHEGSLEEPKEEKPRAPKIML